MAKAFQFDHSFNFDSFVSWATATTGAGVFQGINDPSQLHLVSYDEILTSDDFVSIPIALDAGQQVTLDIDFGANSGDSIDTRVWIIDADGNLVDENDDGFAGDPGSFSGLDSFLNFTALTSGLYFIAVSGFGNNYIDGTFRFDGGFGAASTGDFQLDIAVDNFGIRGIGTNAAQTFNFSGDSLSDRIRALGGDDTVFAGGGLNAVDAGTGGDLVFGGADADHLFGGEGNDTMSGGDGDDVVVGANNNDRLSGGAGRDLVSGGAGIDTVDYTGSAGGVVINLGFRDVQNTVGAGFDTLRGLEQVVGTGLADNIRGSRQDNVLSGEGGGDLLRGGEGSDSLLGGDGNDRLIAGPGNDRLTGGLGRDVQAGGPGEDVYDFNSAAELGIAGTRDQLLGFAHLVDIIDLRDVDANSNAGGNQDFRFLGTGPLTGPAGGLRFGFVGNNTVISMDLNGDGAADKQILLTGNIALSGADFLL